MLPTLVFVALQITAAPASAHVEQAVRAAAVQPPAAQPGQPAPPAQPAQLASPASPAQPAETPRRITQYQISRWTDTDGLPQNSIHSVAQTTDGFIWLASEEGLIRFDGVRFTIFNPATTSALARSQMLAVTAGADGSLWVGTAGSGLVHHRRDSFVAVTEGDGLPSGRVQAVAVDAAGQAWAGTSRGLARLGSDGAVTIFDARGGLPDDDVLVVLAQPDGTVWAGTRAGVARIQGDEVSVFGTRDGLPASEVRALGAARDGGIWVGTSGGGVAHFDGQRFRRLEARLGSAPVLAIMEDRAGALWMGTNGGGLHRWAHGRLETLTTGMGGADLVWSLLEAADGGVWMGTNGRGLFRLGRAPFVPLGEAEGLTGDITLAVLETRAGERWVGTAGAGLNRIDTDGTITRFGAGSALAARMILSLAELPEGALLIGSLGGSLTHFHHGRFTELGSRLGLRHSNMAILPDADGGYWLGTTGGVHHVRGERVTSFQKQDGLADDFVMTLQRSGDGGVWVGTRQGVSRIAGGRVVPFPAQPQLEGIAVAAFFDAGGGRIWAATQGRGVVQVAPDGAVFLDRSHGLCEDLIHAIVDDANGGIWMSSNKGVLRLERQQLEAFFAGRVARVDCALYDRADGLRSREANGGFMPAAARLRDGTLMFPTMQGVVTVDPRHIRVAPVVAPALLQAAVLSGDTLSLATLSELVVATGARDLEVHFTAPSFRAPDRLRFRFRLDDFDNDWRDAGTRRAAYYTNLPPGDYVFRVAVAGDDGIWHETAGVLPVRVPHRFYELWWFLLLCAGAAGVAIWWLHRARMAAARRRTAQLTALVEERTRAEERYRDLFENASDMVFTTDRDGVILSWNAQAEALTGRRKADAVGAPLARVLPEMGAISNRLRRDIHFVKPDGEPAAIEITTRMISEDGEPVGYHVLGRDVLGWRRMQSQLEQAAKMEAVGQLAGGVAHDFNNLLTVISSYGAILDADLPDSSPLRADLEQIRNAANSAAALTRQLLAFGRRQVMQPRVVDVNEEATKVAGMLRRIIGGGIVVELDLEPGIRPVFIDPGQLEQVIMNLALNARDAMPAGGTLRFVTRNTIARERNHRSGLEPGSYVSLVIADTGVGIDPAVLPHLFEPFFTTKEAGRGTGLGLATVYGVVRQSGGHIAVDSAPGAGARFDICLPVAGSAAAVGHDNGERSQPPASPVMPPQQASILLVEDEESVNRLACRILVRNGFNVFTATSGAEALRILERRGPVDLLLTDLVMPGMSGRELATRVRRQHPATRILYMSGYTEDEVIRGGVLAAGEQFIGKPFTPAALVDAATAAIADAEPSVTV